MNCTCRNCIQHGYYVQRRRLLSPGKPSPPRPMLPPRDLGCTCAFCQRKRSNNRSEAYKAKLEAASKLPQRELDDWDWNWREMDRNAAEWLAERS